MNGQAVEVTQGVAARERSIASPSAAPEGYPPLAQVNVVEVRAWSAVIRKRRRVLKPEFILHAEKWR